VVPMENLTRRWIVEGHDCHVPVFWNFCAVHSPHLLAKVDDEASRVVGAIVDVQGPLDVSASVYRDAHVRAGMLYASGFITGNVPVCVTLIVRLGDLTQERKRQNVLRSA